MKQNEPPIDPPDDGYFDDEEREKAERRKDEEDDAAYDRWRETVGGKDTLPKNAEDVVYQVWQVVSGDGSCYVVNKEPIAIAIVEEYVHNMTDQIQKERDELYAEVARLRADNDEIDEVCTRRQLKIYELDAEIAKLRAEREVVYKAAAELLHALSNLDDPSKYGVTINQDLQMRSRVDIARTKLRAALAEKA